MKNIKRFKFLLIVFMMIIAGFGFSAEDPILDEIRDVNKKISQNIFMENTDEVYILINEMLEKYPENAMVNLFAAEKFSKLGEHERAVELASDIALTMFPEDFYYSLLFGEIYHSAGKYEMAKDYFKHALEYENVYPYAYGLLADCYAKLYMNEAAVNMYKTGVYLNSFSCISTIIAYMDFLNDIEAYDEALQVNIQYRIAENRTEKESLAFLRQEMISLSGMGEYEQALTKIEQYVEETAEYYENSFSDAYELNGVKAECLFNLDRKEEAYDLLDEMISIAENDEMKLELLKKNAEMNLSDKAFLDTKRYLTQALSIKSDDVEIHEKLAECYLQLGENVLYKAELKALEELKK